MFEKTFLDSEPRQPHGASPCLFQISMRVRRLELVHVGSNMFAYLSFLFPSLFTLHSLTFIKT